MEQVFLEWNVTEAKVVMTSQEDQQRQQTLLTDARAAQGGTRDLEAPFLEPVHRR